MNSDNANVIKENVNLIKQYIDTKKYKNLKEENYDKYCSDLKDLFPTFSKDYEYLFKKVINGEDLDMLDNILEIMEKVKNNDFSEENGMKIFDEILAKKYLYPVLGKPKNK
jgi:hypothetical protein